MNLKKTVLALAVAGIAAAPMIASAAGHADGGSVYGSVRYGVESVDAGNGTDRVTKMRNFGSRFGIKGETDLGNGMTAFGQYETQMVQSTDSDNVRALKVGIRGDFGQVYVGEDIDHAWDSYMTTDDTWWYGGSQHLEQGVQNNAITYMGGAGPITFGITAQMNEQSDNANEELIDAIEAVVAFDAGPVNIALGMHDKSASPASVDPEAVMGLVLKGDAGGFGYKVDFQSQGAATGETEDNSSFQLQGSFGSFLAQYGSKDNGGASTPSVLVLTYTQSLGANTLIWYEFANSDTDVAGVDATTTMAATLKYNIL
jgi:predicted porin